MLTEDTGNRKDASGISEEFQNSKSESDSVSANNQTQTNLEESSVSDIEFNCTHCGQKLSAPQDMAGQQIGCPVCAGVLIIPNNNSKKPDGGDMWVNRGAHPASCENATECNKMENNASKTIDFIEHCFQHVSQNLNKRKILIPKFDFNPRAREHGNGKDKKKTVGPKKTALVLIGIAAVVVLFAGRSVFCGSKKPVAGNKTAVSKEIFMKSSYADKIALEITTDVTQSREGKQLAAILVVASRSKGGEQLAWQLGDELTGMTTSDIYKYLELNGYSEIANLARRSRLQNVTQGLKYIDRYKFWQASNRAMLLHRYSRLQAYWIGRDASSSNLNNSEMKAILRVLNADPIAPPVDRCAEKIIEHAKHFNLNDSDDREAFAQSLIDGGLDEGLALSADAPAKEVFYRILNVKKLVGNW